MNDQECLIIYLKASVVPGEIKNRKETDKTEMPRLCLAGHSRNRCTEVAQVRPRCRSWAARSMGLVKRRGVAGWVGAQLGAAAPHTTGTAFHEVDPRCLLLVQLLRAYLSTLAPTSHYDVPCPSPLTHHWMVLVGGATLP